MLMSRLFTKTMVITLWSMMALSQALAFEGKADAAAATDQYYTIDEAQYLDNPAIKGAPLQGFAPDTILTLSVRSMVNATRNFALSLLHWTLHPESPSTPPERYNRRLHFGRWINDPTDETCYNTRAKVLLRDTEAPVSYKQTNPCLIDKGLWNDNYSGQAISESRQIQVDHMVPLKDAYQSGAWEWDFQTRCLYANYMGNNFHLITANGIENMRKGDSAPDEYMPPNSSYRCEYLENWLKIKLIWRLKMTPSEVQAIRQSVRENNCDSRKFSLPDGELQRQRAYIRNNLGLCPSR